MSRNRTRTWDNVPLVLEIPVELRISLKCSGYYDPGCRYMSNGDPGYPPCGDDHREVESIEIVTEDGKTIALSGAAWCQIEELFEQQIVDADLPEQEECDE